LHTLRGRNQDETIISVNELSKLGYQADWKVVKHMIYNNFMPGDCDERMLLHIEHIFFHRYNEDTLIFWMVWPIKTIIEWITSFVYKTYRKMEEDAQKQPNSFRLLLFAPKLVYSQSKRAKTTMDMFYKKTRGKVLRLPPNTSWKDFKDLIPVTRYAEGMSKSLFFKDTGDKQKNSYCGTFYYYEPESTTFLECNQNKILKARDKEDAANKLQVEMPKTDMGFHVTFHGGVNRGLMLRPDEFLQAYKQTKRFDYNHRGLEEFFRKENLQSDREFYTAHIFHYYALQDDLDQDICWAAHQQGYQVIFLTHMIGSRQIVFEVMDTRPRNVSFDNLRFLKQ